MSHKVLHDRKINWPQNAVLVDVVLGHCGELDVNEGAVGVIADGGGAWVVPVGGVDGAHREELHDCASDKVDGVSKLLVGHEDETRGAWFYEPFGEIVVGVVTVFHEVADNDAAALHESAADGCFGEDFSVASVNGE